MILREPPTSDAVSEGLLTTVQAWRTRRRAPATEGTHEFVRGRGTTPHLLQAPPRGRARLGAVTDIVRQRGAEAAYGG
jgi:hypothetical protein